MEPINEDDFACKHCGRVIFCGPPCCYQAVYDLWQKAASEVQWLRKIQSKQTKRIQELLKGKAMLRRIEETDLVGKTIKSVNVTAVNCLTLTFEDGTSTELWADIAVSTPGGTISGIFVDDTAEKTDKE